MQYHPWLDRAQFLDMEETAVKEFFREWVEQRGDGGQTPCPWYVRDQYEQENIQALRAVRPKSSSRRQAQPSTERERAEEKAQNDEDGSQGFGSDGSWGSDLHGSEIEKSSGQESDIDTRVLKMLYKGNMAEVNRRVEQQRKAKVVNHKHDYYRKTRVTCTAQEEQSAMPGGVINTHEDSDDDEGVTGEQKEIAMEMQELRAAQHWVNQEGWDAVGEGLAVGQTGMEIDLRLSWSDVQTKLAKGSGPSEDLQPQHIVEEVVLRDYALDKLDPTQRAFADRVLKWAQVLPFPMSPDPNLG